MRVLILGNGGREHALYLKLSESKHIEKIFAANGNAGIDAKYRFSDVDTSDFDILAKVIKDNSINLLVVGSEIPLASGIKDFFQKENPSLVVFGPDKDCARLEASKSFAYNFMVENNIPTARSITAENLQDAKKIIADHPLPIVIKADGLAAGKGVSIHNTIETAEKMLIKIFDEKIFNDAGNKIIIQEFLKGKEASLFVLLNGKEAIYLPTARDYKPVNDKNAGPNTGGMGAYSPGDTLSREQISYAHNHIVKKVLDKFSYRGILYIGLMIHSEKPEDISVVEFNCRLGDPETQVILPMINTDLLPYLLWTEDNGTGNLNSNSDDSHNKAMNSSNDEFVPRIQELDYFHVPQKNGYSINVVLAARGYPNAYSKNIEFNLGENLSPEKLNENIHIIHAGTKITGKKNVFNSTGGRILSIISYEKELKEAKKLNYSFIESLRTKVDFSKIHFRTDIGE